MGHGDNCSRWFRTAFYLPQTLLWPVIVLNYSSIYDQLYIYISLHGESKVIRPAWLVHSFTTATAQPPDWGNHATLGRCWWWTSAVSPLLRTWLRAVSSVSDPPDRREVRKACLFFKRFIPYLFDPPYHPTSGESPISVGSISFPP